MNVMLPVAHPEAPVAAETLRLPLSSQWKVMVVGDPPLTLRGDYDERQMWLPFVRALVIRKEPETPNDQRGKLKKPEKVTGVGLTRKWESGGRIQMSGTSTRLYVHELGVDQAVLPFPDRRRISVKEYKRLMDTGFPGFERMREGDRIPTITFSRDKYDAMIEWCRENTAGRYHVAANFATFERVNDAVFAKLAIPI